MKMKIIFLKFKMQRFGKRFLSAASNVVEHEASNGKTKKFLISAVGKDDVGIVSGFAEVLARQGGNISESRWATFGGDFVAFLNVKFPKKNTESDEVESNSKKIKDIKELLKEKFPKMHFSVHSTSTNIQALEARKYFRVSACGPDMLGLIRDFTQTFKDSGISVQDMSTVNKIFKKSI
jgi:glycine cleavage system regulatory protein